MGRNVWVVRRRYSPALCSLAGTGVGAPVSACGCQLIHKKCTRPPSHSALPITYSTRGSTAAKRARCSRTFMDGPTFGLAATTSVTISTPVS